MEELIRIRLRGPGSSSTTAVLIDASRKISTQVEMFLRKLGLAIDSGDPPYDVHHAENRKILDSSKSFREAGVRENHVLVLLPRVAAPVQEDLGFDARPSPPPGKPTGLAAIEAAVAEVREGRRSPFELETFLPAATAAATTEREKTRLFDWIGRWKLMTGIPWVAQQLKSDTPRVRAGAVRVLVRLQAEDRAGDIHPLLSDPSGEVRGQAALAMSRFDWEDAAPAVLAMLEDPDPDARAGAAQALERTPVKGRDALFLRLLADPHPTVRAAAVDGLASVAPDALRDRLEALFHDAGEDVRRSACTAARELKHRAAVPSLLRLLKGDGADADEAMRTLVDLGAKEVSDLLRLKLDARHEWEQKSALDSLIRLGTVALMDLRRFLHHDKPMLRAASVEALVKLDAKDRIVPFLSDADPQVQVAACAALGGPGEILRLRSFLSDRSAENRATAVKALARLGIRDAAEEITPLLLDTSAWVRINAIDALARLDHLPSVRSVAALLADEDTGVRLMSASALRRLGSRELGPDLLPLLAHPHSRVRLGTLRVLQELDVRDAAAAIEALLRDPHPLVRSNAAARLAMMGSETAKPRLRELLADPKHEVRWLAGLALSSFGETGAVRGALDPSRDPETLSFTLLNGAREPLLWRRLRDTRLASNLAGPPSAIIAAIAEQAGVPAEMSAEFRTRPEPEDTDPLAARSGITLLTALTVTLDDHDLILDPGKIRIVPARESTAEWMSWIGRL